MGRQTTGTYSIKSWDEKTWDGKPWNEVSGSKVTHTIVTQTFTGVIEGEATSQDLMAYVGDTYASFVGLHHVTGSVDGRSGSFVLQSAGRTRTTPRASPGLSCLARAPASWLA